MENLETEVLIAEGNKNDAELTRRVLQKSKIANNIVHLTDGISTLDFLFGKGSFSNRDIAYKPKLILLDINTPVINGLEVLKKIKSDDLTKKIPVVVLVASAESPDIEKAYALGANSCIVKPPEFEGFSKMIAEIGLYWVIMNRSTV